MKEVILKVQDNKFRFFMELIKNLDFVKLKGDEDEQEAPYDPEFVKKIEQGDRDLAEGKGVKLSVDEFRALCK